MGGEVERKKESGRGGKERGKSGRRYRERKKVGEVEREKESGRGCIEKKKVGVRRRGRTGKHGKVGVKKKWWVLARPPYSLQGYRRQSTRVEPFNHGDRPPEAEENPGSR